MWGNEAMPPYRLPVMTGPEVQAARELLGYTREEFAQKLFVGRRTLYRWEHNGVDSQDVLSTIMDMMYDQEKQIALLAGSAVVSMGAHPDGRDWAVARRLCREHNVRLEY